MDPIAKIHALAKDEDTLKRIFALMQEYLSSIKKNGHYFSKPAGFDDWVKLEIDEFKTTKYLDHGYDDWDKMLEVCGSEIGEDGAVFVVYNHPDDSDYFEYASSTSYEDTNYSWGYDRDEVLEEFQESIIDSFDQGKRLYLWFAVEAGFLPANSVDLTNNDIEEVSVPLKWSVGRKEPYVKSVDNAQKKVVFPSTVGKTVVTGIADKFEFKGKARKTVEEIIIPDGYIFIGEKAFNDCPKLKKITLPSTLTRIGENAFSYCPKLENIVIPGSLKKIESWAFTNCKGLKELTIEDGVESIELAAFSDCVKLTDVVIPDSVKKIDACAFEDCSSIKSVKIPENAEIEGAAFKGCKKLADKAGMVIMGNKLLDYVGTEDTVVIPQGVREIGASAFDNNMTVKSITIPDSVKVIGPNAFKWCTRLREISIPKGVEKIYSYTFCNCRDLKNVDIPDSVIEIGECAFIGCRLLNIIDLPENVQTVNAHAFSNQNNPASGLTIVIRNPDLVMHETCLEGCRNYIIYAPEGSIASQFSPSRTKPLQEYDEKN